jgi:hypothetical protein
MARRRLRARVNWVVRWGGVGVAALVTATYCLGPRFNPSFHWHAGPAMAQGVYFRGIVVANVAWSERAYKAPNDVVIHWAAGEWSWLWGQFSLEGQSVSAISQVTLTCPLWSFALVAAALSGLGWCRHQRRRSIPVSPCPSCAYDLSGLPAGSPCPECAAVQKE